MLERSQAAKFAKFKFFTAYNEIDIFIEDTARGSKKIFTELLRRAFSSSISIDAIFPLGPRSVVIKRCASDQGERNRRAIYIVDGDYDIALAKSPPSLRRLYVLKRYCIENYLLDYDAISSVLSDSSLDLDIEAIAKKVDLNGWHRNVERPLNLLTMALIVASAKKCAGLPSVNLDLSSIQLEEMDKIDETKAAALVEHYSIEIDRTYGPGTFESECAALKATLRRDTFDFRVYASGKAISLPLLRKRVERKLGALSMSNELFKARLASRCDITELEDIPEYTC